MKKNMKFSLPNRRQWTSISLITVLSLSTLISCNKEQLQTNQPNAATNDKSTKMIIDGEEFTVTQNTSDYETFLYNGRTFIIPLLNESDLDQNLTQDELDLQQIIDQENSVIFFDGSGTTLVFDNKQSFEKWDEASNNTSSQTKSSSSPRAWMYEDRYYAGEVILRSGSFGASDTDLHANGWGDRISSIIVDNARASFAEHPNHGGKTLYMVDNNPSTTIGVGISSLRQVRLNIFHSWDDKISSFSILTTSSWGGGSGGGGGTGGSGTGGTVSTDGNNQL